jgi:hypothetical protein
MWREAPRYQLLQQSQCQNPAPVGDSLPADLYPQRNKFRSELPAVCQCSRKTGCDENCINRFAFVEWPL